MPPEFVSVDVVPAVLLGTVVEVSVFVALVDEAGTQFFVEEGLVVVVSVVLPVVLVAEAGGIVDSGVAGATVPAPGAFVVFGVWVVEPGAIPGVWLGVWAAAIPALSSNVEMNKDVRVINALSLLWIRYGVR
jgi:ABC-type glycerol-3-phosphate transport system substrate-binding protein